MREALRQEGGAEEVLGEEAERVVEGRVVADAERGAEGVAAPPHPSGARLATSAALLAAAFFALLIAVASGHRLGSIDLTVADFVARHREPWLTSVFELLTWLGSTAVLAPLAGGVGGWLRRETGSWRPLLVLAASLAGAFGLSQLVKHAVGRARPDDQLVHAIGYAFPSGHATFAAAGWPALAILLAGVLPTHRRALLVGALAVIALVGASRVYLGVHWTSDVLGGWALGALWLMVVLAAATQRRRTTPAPPR